MNCPAPTQAPFLNSRNRLRAIREAMYGPVRITWIGQKVRNLGVNATRTYWKRIANRWGLPVDEAIQRRCGNCSSFDTSAEMVACGGASSDGDVGYCHAWNFTCAARRTLPLVEPQEVSYFPWLAGGAALGLAARRGGRRAPLTLYHGTSSTFAPEIARRGICGHYVYLGIVDVADYYAEAVVDEVGGSEALFVVEVPHNLQSRLEPDYGGIEEPLTYTLGKSEESVWEEWDASAQTWEDSLRIIGSVRLKLDGGCVPPSYVREA